MRKALLTLGVLVALAVPAAATAKAPPPAICGGVCDSGGTGWTGCTSQAASDAQGIRWVSWFRHYLVVSYCKVNGVIRSASIAAHGCRGPPQQSASGRACRAHPRRSRPTGATTKA